LWWPFGTRSRMERQFHLAPGTKRSSELHKMYQSPFTAKNSWWWAERLPETCTAVIPIKLEFGASVGFIQKESVTMHGYTIVKSIWVWKCVGGKTYRTWKHTLYAWCAFDILVLICLSTAIGLSPGGSSTVHIYTQTAHRTTQNKQYIEQHNNYGIVRAVPRLGYLYPGICLTTEEKARKNLSQGSRI